ncbi:MAG: hypothetical protein J1E40_05650 [Oscillospiraceae bacterium]|nr:hypothetical protein [Oscillospiraceae bacterium]
MKKKILGKIAAVSLAGLTAIPALSIVSSALTYDADKGTVSGTVWTKTETVYNPDGTVASTHTTYFDNKADADNYKGENGGGLSATGSMDVTSWVGAGGTVYKNDDGTLSKDKTSGAAYTATSSGNTSTDSSTTAPSSSSYTSYYHWYSSVTGKYYSSRADAITASGGNSSAVHDATPTNSSSSNSYSSYYHYYSTVTKRYYPTWDAAVAASGGDSTKAYDATTYNTSGYYPYFSTVTGRYYATKAEALAASGGDSSKVVYVGNGYYNGYYYGYYGYYGYDPVSYYYYTYLKNDSSSSSSSSSKDTSTVTINGKTGWTSVTSAIKSASSGKTLTVNMKNEITIPASVMSALKGKNVNIDFRLSNGVVFTINGGDISSAKDINIATTYNTNRIPSQLVKKAYKKHNAVSSAQLSVNNNTFGAYAGITVKFSSNRSGRTARLYRYNSDKNTLSLVSSARVQNSGQCTFDSVTKGGDFVIVLS